jgi:hypothetical protein
MQVIFVKLSWEYGLICVGGDGLVKNVFEEEYVDISNVKPTFFKDRLLSFSH